jgi:hypothetical protein
MRFWYANLPEVLPADWQFHIEPVGELHRIRIERPSGKRMTLEEALDAAALEMTSSRPNNKVTILKVAK